MKYMGSKSRVAKYIVPILQQYIDQSGTNVYIEPFVGGANVIDKIGADCRIGFDINQYLIALFEHLRYGGTLPDEITREEYAAVRSNKDIYPRWYVGCVGFLASYNGRFFDGGYAKAGYETTSSGKRYRNYYREARDNILQQANNLYTVSFGYMDYKVLAEAVKLDGFVIYCDPPYAGTKQYANSKGFNHDQFWEVMRNWSKNNIVLISEQDAPDDFTCIWQQDVSRSIKAGDKSRSVEKLFKYAG